MERKINVDDRCTGCNVCISLCPTGAISLKASEEGFWYPSIDQNLCVECGKCLRGCPIYGGKDKSLFIMPISYVGWNNDVQEHLNSSSGGIFSIFAREILKVGGTVYGAAYDNKFSIEHIRIDSIDQLERLRGSKYVQSFIPKELLDRLKEDIDSGRKVLFSGTPCQVAAVNKLYSQYDNLLTIDVVCHGVPSPKAWRSYLKETTAQHGEIKAINMRKKTMGWKKIFFHTEYFDGAIQECWFNDNIWGLSFVKNLFLRKSCYHCEFKENIRCSDISLGDFWDASRGIHKELDDHDRGTSIILVNSEKGKRAFEEIESGNVCFLKNIPYHWIPKNTYAVTKSSSYNPRRAEAFTLLDSKRFTSLVQALSSKGLLLKAIKKIKTKGKQVIYLSLNRGNVEEVSKSAFCDIDADVGILNVQEVDNYGAVLLCFALQKTIESLGYRVKIIDFRPLNTANLTGYKERLIRKMKKDGMAGLSEAVLRRATGRRKAGVNISSNLKRERFEQFRRTFLNRTSIYSGMEINDSPIFGTYVVGSDVVWKPGRVMSKEAETYFLAFTEGLICNRIAYAASIGTDDEKSLDEMTPLFESNIKRFDHVSLRESSSIPYVKRLYDGNVTWCIDPTLLLTRDKYDQYFSLDGSVNANDYIYLYLFENNEAAYNLVNRYSDELGIPVICQCNEPNKINNLREFSTDDGPIEFLLRIKNARMVVTDSFHGTVFSIIYQKEFITISRGNISIRMKDLLTRLGLLSRYVENPKTIDLFKSKIDYEYVKQIIDVWRDESMNYLKTAIESKKSGGALQNSNSSER